MSVTATIETRTHTNVLAAPFASVTTRTLTNVIANFSATNVIATNSTDIAADKKSDKKNKPVDVVFVVEKDHVKTVPVKLGISDDDYYEITDGLKVGDEIVTGNFHAISHDLDDGKKITITTANTDTNSVNEK